uniref:hypothetical protein n=1 Tax=Vibrio cholerae TaxID=666 RepID=UPI003F5855A6
MEKELRVIELYTLRGSPPEKQQELKELEYSLGQKETSIVQKEHELKAAKDAIAKKKRS